MFMFESKLHISSFETTVVTFLLIIFMKKLA